MRVRHYYHPVEYLHHLKHSLADWWFAEQSRWVLWLPVCIGVGIASYFSLPFEPSLVLTSTLLGIATASLCVTYANPALRVFPIAILAGVLGFSAAHYRTYAVDAPTLKEQTTPIWVEGTITMLEQKSAHQVRIILEQLEIDDLAHEPPLKRVRLTVRTDLRGAKVGDRVALRAALRPPSRPVVEGGYHFARYAYFQQLGATGYSLTPLYQRDSAHYPHAKWKSGLENLRNHIADRVHAVLPSDVASIVTALMIGEYGQLEKKKIEAMRAAGLAHLLAVSGMHLGLITGICFLSIRSFLALFPTIALRYNTKYIAAAMAILGSFAYLHISGMHLSTQRAFIMVSLMLCAIFVHRMVSPLRSVAVAASVVLLIQPESLLSPSFQMSFAAVTALIAVYEWLRKQRPSFFRPLPWGGNIIRYVVGVSLTSLIAGTATVPFAVFHFQHYEVATL